MKKKYVLLVVIVFIFQVFATNFSYVKAEANTSICSGPSETMSLYFDFQNEMKSALLGSEINERRFSVHVGSGGLFSNQVLILTKDTAIDLLANSLWNRTRSVVSTATTSVVLIALASVSAAQSSTVGLSILFRDRPIVRDYKTMMDIETDLFDVAYFLSKQVNITRPVDGEMHDNIRLVIQKYQDLGLLDESAVELNDNVSIADVLWDLVWMNATMEVFIAYDSHFVLDKYHGCMNRTKGEGCVAVLKFSDEAITSLKSDYKGTFGKCNSNFKSSMSKIGSSFLDEQKSGWQDVKDAMGRLKSALVGGWKKSNKKEEKCKGVPHYKMAQITAYRGNDWTCDEAEELYSKMQSLKKQEKVLAKEAKKAAKEAKKAAKEEAKKTDGETKNKTKEEMSKGKKTTTEKKQEWYYVYGAGCEFNTEYSSHMDDDFVGIYNSIKEANNLSITKAQSSDLSFELKEILGLIDQIGSVEEQSKHLEESLKKIADYQCAG